MEMNFFDIIMYPLTLMRENYPSTTTTLPTKKWDTEENDQ